MKYICLFCVLLVSCSNVFNTIEIDTIRKDEALKIAWLKTASHTYIPEAPREYWKSHTEFDADGGGDCEDFSSYLVYLLGPEASVVIIKEDTIIHAIVKYRGFYIEPQRYGIYYTDAIILWEFNYYETMAISTFWGTKSIPLPITQINQYMNSGYSSN